MEGSTPRWSDPTQKKSCLSLVVLEMPSLLFFALACACGPVQQVLSVFLPVGLTLFRNRMNVHCVLRNFRENKHSQFMNGVFSDELDNVKFFIIMNLPTPHTQHHRQTSHTRHPHAHDTTDRPHSTHTTLPHTPYHTHRTDTTHTHTPHFPHTHPHIHPHTPHTHHTIHTTHTTHIPHSPDIHHTRAHHTSCITRDVYEV